MAETKTKTSTRTAQKAQPAAPPRSEGLYVNGVYTQKVDGVLIAATLACSLDIKRKTLKVMMVSPGRLPARLEVGASDTQIPGWTYVGGGVSLEQVLKAGA